MEKFKVQFLPDNKSIEVNKDTSVLSAAVSAGVYINSICGGEGVCGRCKVRVKKGKVFTQQTGILTLDEKRQGLYLACLTTVQSDLEIEIPVESRLGPEGLTPEELHASIRDLYSESEEMECAPSPLKEDIFKHSPLVRKLYLELPKPTLHDKISDTERLTRQIKREKNIADLELGLADMRELSELLRSSDWKVTVTMGASGAMTAVMLIEPGDTTQRNYGFCFDIGTTTISGQLVDLNTKTVLGTKGTFNRQISFGSDVITRIIYAKEEEGLEKLHLAVVDCINQIIKDLTAENHVDLNAVAAILCAGNTTMIQLLLSIDPTYIRKEPYVATANFLPTFRAAEIGIRINPRGILKCAPGVASYLGADMTAGVLSCGLDREKDLCLLIDIGTNGEIVLGSGEFLVGCAASAGPAFEGSGVTCGMRATKGAIQNARIDQKDFSVTCDTIAGAKARGICGSGYIEIISEMLGLGLIDRSGKIRLRESARVRSGDSGKEFVLVFKGQTASNKDIIITEADIENLKRAKAAIYAAASTLVRHMGFKFSDIKKIFIAGGFGTSINVSSAIEIGLLPDLELSRFIFVGNSSLAGSRQMLLSDEARHKADEIALKMTYIELSVEPGYTDEYMAALFFPHTDLRLFPNVKRIEK